MMAMIQMGSTFTGTRSQALVKEDSMLLTIVMTIFLWLYFQTPLEKMDWHED